MKLTVIGCSPAWPNPGGAQSGYLVEGEGRLLLDCGPGRARPAARARRRLAARRRGRDHALPPRPLGRPRAVDLRRDVRRRARSRAARALAAARTGPSALRHSATELSFGERIDGVFASTSTRTGSRFAAAGFDVTPVALDALRPSDLRPARQRPRQHARLLRRHGAERQPRRARARRGSVPLRGDARSEPEPDERGHLTEDEAVDAFRASGARRLLVIHRPDELPLADGLERAPTGSS